MLSDSAPNHEEAKTENQLSWKKIFLFFPLVSFIVGSVKNNKDKFNRIKNMKNYASVNTACMSIFLGIYPYFL